MEGREEPGGTVAMAGITKVHRRMPGPWLVHVHLLWCHRGPPAARVPTIPGDPCRTLAGLLPEME